MGEVGSALGFRRAHESLCLIPFMHAITIVGDLTIIYERSCCRRELKNLASIRGVVASIPPLKIRIRNTPSYARLYAPQDLVSVKLYVMLDALFVPSCMIDFSY